MPDKGDSATSPALDVCLAHEVGLQFGHHNADDPDEDEEVHLQAEGRATGGPLKTPSRPRPPLAPGPTAAPTACPQHHSPRWRRGWAAGL